MWADVSAVSARPAARSEAFAAFYHSTWSALFGYCAGLCGDRVLAEELTQEAMARVFSRFGSLSDPRPYSFRVVTNLVHDVSRRRRREQLEPDVVQVAQVVGVDPFLLDAVRRLPLKEREVVLLHYYNELPVQEVGQILRRPVGTVKRQLHTARARLADALGGADAQA